MGCSFTNSSFVTCTASPEAMCLTQMFFVPLCVELKAIFLPSGENEQGLSPSPGALRQLMISVVFKDDGSIVASCAPRRADSHHAAPNNRAAIGRTNNRWRSVKRGAVNMLDRACDASPACGTETCADGVRCEWAENSSSLRRLLRSTRKSLTVW